MKTRTGFSAEEAKWVASELGIVWHAVDFDLDEFRLGLDTELEHGTREEDTNVTGDDPVLTGKIALAHLRELPDYYTRLKRMEAEAIPLAT